MNQLLTITGPSGVGKTTLVNHLLQHYGNYFGDAIAFTTRKPRNGEIDGKDYHFVDEKKIGELKKNGEIAALSGRHDNHYGHTFDSIKAACEDEKTGLIITDTERIPQYKTLTTNTQLQVISILILPPSYVTLGKRVLTRVEEGQLDSSATLERWKTGWEEFVKGGREKGLYDYEVINSTLESTVKNICRKLEQET